MAAPTVVSITSTLISVLTSNPTINLDASVAQGDLVYIVLCAGRNRPIGITWPAGWTELLDINNTTGNQMEQSHAWRIMPSSPPTTVQVTSAGTIAIQAWAIRIAGGDFDSGTAPEVATIINSGDPPSLNPSWGNEDTRYGSSLTRDGSLGTITYPFANNQLSTNGGIFGSAAMCTGAVTADSQDPAAWVSTTTGTAVMFAIRAAPSGTEHQATLTAALGFTSSVSATVEHPAVVTGVLGFTSAVSATVEHPAVLSASLGFESTVTATRETAATLTSGLGFSSGIAATVEHPATLSSPLGFTSSVAAVVVHPATLAADLGFSSHIEATSGAVHEAILTADLGFTSSLEATVAHAATLAAALGFGSVIAVGVTHPMVLVADLGFVSHLVASGGSSHDPVAATFTEAPTAVFAEDVGPTYRESPAPTFQEAV